MLSKTHKKQPHYLTMRAIFFAFTALILGLIPACNYAENSDKPQKIKTAQTSSASVLPEHTNSAHEILPPKTKNTIPAKHNPTKSISDSLGSQAATQRLLQPRQSPMADALIKPRNLKLHQQFLAMPNATLIIHDAQGMHYSRNPDLALIPASTLKIFTALRAIERWGFDHKFSTRFYFDANQNTLWVKGFGDPFLVSEELQIIAQALAPLLNTQTNTPLTIAIDGHYFATNLAVDGSSDSANPYDAPLSAVAANFNTINIIKKNRTITPAEPQTPLTPLAYELARALGNGKHRINVKSEQNAQRYFGELLRAFLQKNTPNLSISPTITRGTLPASATLIYTHSNSHDLEFQLKGMLKYSNNFIANQLFMMLGDTQASAHTALNLRNAQLSARTYAHQRLNLTVDFYDGAGLSRHNNISARQFLRVLEAFEPYKALLTHDKNMAYKTGSLSGVNTLAGYLLPQDKPTDHGQHATPFVLFINQTTPYHFKTAYMASWR